MREDEGNNQKVGMRGARGTDAVEAFTGQHCLKEGIHLFLLSLPAVQSSPLKIQLLISPALNPCGTKHSIGKIFSVSQRLPEA